MAAVSDVCAGLIQHKATLLRELCDTNILDVLVKKGLFNLNDLELITGAVDSDKCNYFIELVSKQSGLKLQELCAVLNKECPKLSKELMNDRHRYVINGYSTTHSAKENMVMNYNLNRRKRWLEVIGRPDLDNPKTNPKCYFVCSLHFEKYMITSKPILKLDAEPIKFLPNQPTLYVSCEEHREASTQTESHLNGSLVIKDDSNSYPEVPIVNQEEAMLESINMEVPPRIKQERIETDTEPDATNGEDVNEDTQTPVASKKARGKTKEPRKARKFKSRNELKELMNKKNLQIKVDKM